MRVWTQHPRASELQMINPAFIGWGVALATVMLVCAVRLDHVDPTILILVPAAAFASFFLWLPSLFRIPGAIAFVLLLAAVVRTVS